MPLETLPNRFDDATHDKLDKTVNEVVDIADPEDLSAGAHAYLLGAIVDNCDGLNKEYLRPAHVKKLFATYEGLRPMLASAWRRKSYREIRNLGGSRNPTHHRRANQFSVIPTAILRAPEPEQKQVSSTTETDTREG